MTTIYYDEVTDFAEREKSSYFCLFTFIFCLFIMIYPENFEYKIGFDRIRKLLSEKCLSPMGLEKVDEIEFIDDFESLSSKLSATFEFQQILQFEDFFPNQNTIIRFPIA